jgi:ABC-type amino acid transport substrate-binding protein
MTAATILNANADDAATINSWSDRNPATIVKRTAKTITVQRDTTAHMSGEGHDAYAHGHGEVVIFTRDYDAGLEVFTLRKNGRWIQQGQPLRGGRSLTVGVRDFYRDPSF